MPPVLYLFMDCKSATRKKLLCQAVLFSAIIVLFFGPDAHALLPIGEEAPGFSLKDLDGRDTTLSQFAGKKIVVLFWSTWSVNSPRALKRFEEFHKKYSDKGIEVVAINADNQTISKEDTENISRLARELHITFPVLVDNGLKTFRGYDVVALPSTVVVSEGKVAYNLPGFPLVGTEEMFDYLSVLAGEKPRQKIEPKFVPRFDAVANAKLAMQFVKRQEFEFAVPLFKKAIEKDQAYIFAYVELAKIHVMEGNNAEAEAVLRKAVSVSPDDPAALSELGHLLSKTGKSKEAIETLRKAAKHDSYTPAYYYLAYALARDGQTAEAFRTFEKALSLNPFDPKIYRLRAEVYEKDKKLKEASTDYRKALELLLNIR